MKFQLNLKGKQAVLIYCIGGSIFVIFIAYFIFGGLASRSRQLNHQIKLAEEKFKKGLGIQKRKDVMLAEYQKNQQYLLAKQKEKRQIPEELLRETERIAKESGASIINLSPQEFPEETKEYKKYKADLRMETTCEQAINFLIKIKDSPLLIKLDKLSLSPKDEQASALRVEATVSIAVL